MLRRCLILIVLATGTSLPAGGCRSCSDCHDYDGPVMGCEGGYGHRAGSVCGCAGCGGHGGVETHGGYENQFAPYEGQPVPADESMQPDSEDAGN